MTITTETVNKLYNINLSNFEVEEFLKKQAIEIEDVKNSEDEVLSKEGTDILVIFFPSNYKLIQFIQSINLISAAIDIGWLFVGIEEFKKLIVRSIIIRILGVACIFIWSIKQ